MKRPFALLGFAALAVLAGTACLEPDCLPALALACAGLGVSALLALLMAGLLKRKGPLLLSKKPLGPVRPGAFSMLFPGACVLLTAALCLTLYSRAAGGKRLLEERLDGGRFRVRGTMLDYPEEAYHKCRYLIRVEHVFLEGKALELPEFTASVSTWQSFACSPRDSLECDVCFYAFDGSGGLYSSRNSRWADGVDLGGYLTDYGSVQVIPRAGLCLESVPARLRHFLGSRFEQVLPKEEAGLIRAVLLGEKSRISQRTSWNFQRIGASHLLVVSGLHMTALAGFVFLLLSGLPLGKRSRNAMAALLLLAFLTLIGFPPAAVRSGVMFLLSFLAQSLGRKADPINSLGFAALLICLMNPFSGGDLGFTLSVLSTLGILGFAKPIGRGLLRPFRRFPEVRRILRPAAVSLGTTFGATLATLPLQLAVFGGISLLAPLSSLLLIFPCALLLYFSLASAFFSLFLTPGLDYPFQFCAGWLARLILWAAEQLARIPAAFLSLRGPFWLPALGLIALLGALFLLLGRDRCVKLILTAAVFLFCGCGWALEARENQGEKLVLAAAADSSCVAVIRGDRAAVLSLGGFRTEAVLSLLTRNNVRRVETLCMPVRDLDAREAAKRLLETYGAGTLVLPADAYAGRDLLLAGSRCRRVSVKDGESFQILEGVEATAYGDMSRLSFSASGVSVMVETGDSGEGSCQLLFTTQRDSRINSSFTILQRDDIMIDEDPAASLRSAAEGSPRAGMDGGQTVEEFERRADLKLLAGLPEGRYLLPGRNGLFIDLLPDGTVTIRGDACA